MNIRYLLIGLVVILIAIVVFMSNPFPSTVDEEPGQPSPHAVDQ
ncbi:MAG TPA: hypothetical protein VFY63_06430 [Pseudorhizobium sp.]|nr:hypothetical protein [Pseudorhizobium sp.]